MLVKMDVTGHTYEQETINQKREKHDKAVETNQSEQLKINVKKGRQEPSVYK